MEFAFVTFSSLCTSSGLSNEVKYDGQKYTFSSIEFLVCTKTVDSVVGALWLATETRDS